MKKIKIAIQARRFGTRLKADGGEKTIGKPKPVTLPKLKFMEGPDDRE